MFDAQTIKRMNSAGNMTKSEVLENYGGAGKVFRVASNTWEYVAQSGIRALVYHRTEILVRWPSGAVTLNTGGWNTLTTRDRLNRFQHAAQVYSERGAWRVRVRRNGKDYPFTDGMTILPENCADDVLDARGVRVLPIPYGTKAKAIKIGNLITEALELWGGLTGYWDRIIKGGDDDLFRLMDKIEAEGLERMDAWDLMDPFLRGKD